MLLKANITKDIVKQTLSDDPKIKQRGNDLLVEQLYIFLKDFVKRRLKYEHETEREDCIQDTILFMLKRFNALSIEDLKHINIEKFFYNRANSFISSYINKLKIRRKIKLTLNKKVPSNFPGSRLYDTEYLDFIEDESQNPEKKLYINYPLLYKIIKKFRLGEEQEHLLKRIAVTMLGNLGYENYNIKVYDLNKDDPDRVLYTLSFAVIDEYLLTSVKESGDNYKSKTERIFF